MRAFCAWAVDARSWQRILYLVLALPLSAFYSVVILAGLSVGLGVAILTLGLPLVLMMGFWRWMARFERWLGERLLGVPLPSPYRPSTETPLVRAAARAHRRRRDLEGPRLPDGRVPARDRQLDRARRPARRRRWR